MRSFLFVLIASSSAGSTAAEGLRGTSSLRDVGDGRAHVVTPLFWHVPKAGGTTVSDLLTACLHLPIASEVGVLNGHQGDTQLALVDIAGLIYVNVDTTSLQGIQRAHDMRFADAQPARVVFTSYLSEAIDQLFTADHPAALFTLLRHPVSRAASIFYYLQVATWEMGAYRPDWANMTLLHYATSEHAEHNWMTQMLVGKQEPTIDDLEEAKGVLSKMHIGFVNNMEGSLQRFGRAFGWTDLPAWSQCIKDSHTRPSNQNDHPAVKPNSEEWNALLQNNQLDLELYNYALQIYDEQEKLYSEDIQ